MEITVGCQHIKKSLHIEISFIFRRLRLKYLAILVGVSGSTLERISVVNSLINCLTCSLT